MKHWISVIAVMLVIFWATPEASASEISCGLTESSMLTAESSVGDSISLAAEIRVSGEDSFSLHVSLTDGLGLASFDDILCDGARLNPAYYTAITRYCADGCALEVHFPVGILTDTVITVSFTVSVCDKAAGDGEERVSVALREGERYTCAPVLSVRTQRLMIYRGVQLGETEPKPLRNACFSLTPVGEHQALRFVPLENGDYRVCLAEECGHQRHVRFLRTAENGTISIEGLAAGSYFLTEIKPPKGYDPECEDLLLSVKSDGSVICGESPQSGGIRLVTVRTGAPGGMSFNLTEFYIGGSIVLTLLLLSILLSHLLHPRRA